MDERLIMAIVANKDDDLKYKKQQIELYFSIHPEETDRAEYLKSAYQDRYTEILVDGVRVGYKPQADGLLMWEGAYLSRTSESVFSWGVVAGWTAQLIEKKEYFINTKITPPKSYDSQQLSLFDFADFNNPAQEDGGQISFMSRPELPQQVIDEALCIGANDRNSRLIICAYFMKDHTEDDILICDPEGEFAPLVEAMGSDIGTVISVAAGGKDRLNAMYMVEGYGENNPIVEKSQFIMSLVEQIDKHGVGPQHKSIIDRCTALVYQEAEETGIIPTLCTLREKLMEQPEEKAREIALSLELFTTGSLDIFGHGSNVDLDKRVVVFNIHDLGEQLKPTGLLVITDTMLNRVTLNWKRGKRTHVFIDEFHVVFENEYSGNFFNSAWRQFRKRNAYPTAITQNVEYLLDSVQASTMLSNSEFIVMLNQAASDREKLARLLNISNEQMSYVTNADAGCGLIKYGSALVPFVNRFPKDTQLYKLMTTKPGEGVFGGEGKEVTA